MLRLVHGRADAAAEAAGAADLTPGGRVLLPAGLGGVSQASRPIDHGTSVVVSVASNYQGALGGMFGHVEIEMDRHVIELADGSTVVMCEFGLIVTQPGAAPNQFIPWGACAGSSRRQPPPAQPDDGQQHD